MIVPDKQTLVLTNKISMADEDQAEWTIDRQLEHT